MKIASPCRRITGVLASAGALTILAAGPASAHHCLKEWNDAARAKVSSGTSWMAMSDYIAFATTEYFGLSAACGDHADDWTATWMEWRDVTTEPTVHMKATAGGGAQHKKGKEPGPFFYLADADYDFLEGMIFAEPDCEV